MKRGCNAYLAFNLPPISLPSSPDRISKEYRSNVLTSALECSGRRSRGREWKKKKKNRMDLVRGAKQLCGNGGVESNWEVKKKKRKRSYSPGININSFINMKRGKHFLLFTSPG